MTNSEFAKICYECIFGNSQEFVSTRVSLFWRIKLTYSPLFYVQLSLTKSDRNVGQLFELMKFCIIASFKCNCYFHTSDLISEKHRII